MLSATHLLLQSARKGTLPCFIDLPHVHADSGEFEGSKSLGRAPGLTLCFGKEGASPNRKDPIFHPLNRLLRILFLVSLFRLRAFLLHLSKHLRHVLDLVPNIKTYVDRGALLSR